MTGQDKSAKRWTRPLLVASLALNLLCVGAALGFALVGGRHWDDRRGPGGVHAMPYYRALSDDDQQALRDALRRDFRQHRQSRGRVAEDYRAVVAALRADPFDPADLLAVLDRQGARARERLEGGQRVMVEFVSGMTPQERAAYAERLSDQIDRLAERWGRVERD